MLLISRGKVKTAKIVEETVIKFNEIPPNEVKFIYLMLNENPILLSKLGEFVYTSFEKRQLNLNNGE